MADVPEVAETNGKRKLLTKKVTKYAFCENETIDKKDPNRRNDHRKHKLYELLKLNLQNFHQMIALNRRRSQQRIRHRHKRLRHLFAKQLLQMQMNYVEMFSTLLNIQNPTKNPNQEPKTDIPFERVMRHFNEEQWLHSLRTTQGTFIWICEQLNDTLRNMPAIHNANTKQVQLKPNLHVALALYTLAHTGEHNRDTIGQLFSVPSVLVDKYLEQFASALLQKLGHVLLTLPKLQSEYDDIRYNFQQLSNMPPLVVGVIGVCTLPLANGTNGRIRMESVIDDRMLFRKLQIFSKPTPALLSEEHNEISELPHQKIDKRELSCFVLAPVQLRYPLRPWLLQGYVNPIAPHEYDFNEAADSLHSISKQALQRLFSRWQYLAQPLDLKVDISALIITAGCALHNLLEEQCEPFLQEWSERIDISGFLRADCIPKPNSYRLCPTALNIRDFLARTISSTEI